MSNRSPVRGDAPYRLRKPLRIVTATALFDGHDAAINLIRRLLQSSGAEVIHLGHNRSVDDIVTAALQEDAHAVAVTSYQGGHQEFYTYLLERLRAGGGAQIRVFGGGGGVIRPDEIRALMAAGVTRLYSPEDGARLGLQGMVDDLLQRSDFDLRADAAPAAEMLDVLRAGDRRAFAQILSALEEGYYDADTVQALHAAAATTPVPVLGITGTGGAGKSSLSDELLRRLRNDAQNQPMPRVALLSIDPTRARSGGALLGDRIRMNAIDTPSIFMRSLATRGSGAALPAHLADLIAACKVAGHELIVVETPGIGQGETGIRAYADVALYVMTPEFGAASQLEKIDMLDFADVIAINKFDRHGAEDALRDVRKQYQRNHQQFAQAVETLPVYGTIAARYDDDGVNALYAELRSRLQRCGLRGSTAPPALRVATTRRPLIPDTRTHYLADIAACVRNYHRRSEQQAQLAHRCQALRETLAALDAASPAAAPAAALIGQQLAECSAALDDSSRAALADWDALGHQYAQAELDGQRLQCPTLSGTPLPRVALPRLHDDGDRLRYWYKENRPGSFPYTAGVFAFKREDEEPTRMFAGEGDAARTNRRFHELCAGMAAQRLSTAFDSVTLYGADPARRPDIYGKIGNAGVSIATLDDMRRLYEGFDLCAPTTSVSMTINGPAPILLAMYLNVAIDQQYERYVAEHGHAPDAATATALRAHTLQRLRGTVQADILKEDQGQNTCLFATDFALRLMADVQTYFVEQRIRNFYTVSISGYHIAEAGANPITQLAFTLANGFTYVEAWLARGLAIDDFAPNLSFFFSNGVDAEYAVIGRVARRIWAIALRERYGADARSQKLKYHIQTSGRSLHAQEMSFNDIRTTLQALNALNDHCNSLHTNAYDEAITTPTTESLRRALAIQLVINREWGLSRNENPLQGSYLIDWLSDAVEARVLEEFERLAQRGGVLGAMETGYQRGRIQDESLLYEQRKHDGSLPVIGVNTFRSATATAEITAEAPLARSTTAEKESQLQRLADFQQRHAQAAPAQLARLREALQRGDNSFAILMDAVRVCSLGQISATLHAAGGAYRRNL